MRVRILIWVVALAGIPGVVHAADLTFTQEFVANFEFNVLGGTPINPGGDTGFKPYEAMGALTFTLDPSLNDPSMPTTVPFTNVTGTLNGVDAALGSYTISPDLQFLGGDLTNIVRDGSGNVISANVVDLSMRWDLVAFGGGLTLYTKDGLPFNSVGSVNSLPFSDGTVLAGAADFNVYMEGGPNTPVVIGRDRTLTAVPEPSAVVLAGTAVVAMLGYATRKRSGSVQVARCKSS